MRIPQLRTFCVIFWMLAILYRIKDISARIDSLPEAEREYLYDAARYFVGVMQKEGEADD